VFAHGAEAVGTAPTIVSIYLDQQIMLLARHQRLIDVMTDTAADVSSDHV